VYCICMTTVCDVCTGFCCSFRLVFFLVSVFLSILCVLYQNQNLITFEHKPQDDLHRSKHVVKDHTSL
jgi:hypothetical protein